MRFDRYDNDLTFKFSLFSYTTEGNATERSSRTRAHRPKLAPLHQSSVVTLAHLVFGVTRIFSIED